MSSCSQISLGQGQRCSNSRYGTVTGVGRSTVQVRLDMRDSSPVNCQVVCRWKSLSLQDLVELNVSAISEPICEGDTVQLSLENSAYRTLALGIAAVIATALATGILVQFLWHSDLLTALATLTGGIAMVAWLRVKPVDSAQCISLRRIQPPLA